MFIHRPIYMIDLHCRFAMQDSTTLEITSHGFACAFKADHHHLHRLRPLNFTANILLYSTKFLIPC